MSYKILHLEKDDEITSVIDQLSQTEESEVFLVVPDGAQLCQSLVNLKLLKREADNLEKNITLITPDELAGRLALKADLAIKSSLERNTPKAPNIIWDDHEEKAEERDILDALVEELEPDDYQDKNQKAELATAKRMVDIVRPPQRPKAKFKPTDLLKKLVRPSVRREIREEKRGFFDEPEILKKETASKRFYIFFIFLGLSLILAGLAAYLVLPRTKIILSPQTENISLDISITGSKNIFQIDAALNKIPVQLVRVEKKFSREFEATGEKELNEKAKGIITVYNGYSSSPQTLVATTRFLSGDGKLFRSVKAVTVPGAKIEEGKIIASVLDVEALADQPGKDYNIGPTNFTIPGFKGTEKYSGFYGKSKALMSGGATGKMKVVSADDLKKAEESLTQEASDKIKQALYEQMPADLKLLEDALVEKIVESSSNPGLEVPAERFVFEIKTVAQALLFKEKDLKDLIDLNLSGQIDQNKRLLSQTREIIWEKPVVDWDKTEASLSLKIQEEAAFKIDIEKLKENLAGLSEIEVRKYLTNQSEIKEAKVSSWPFWVKRVPFEKNRIKITIQGVD